MTKPKSTGCGFFQRADNIHHALRVQAAVFLQFLPHPASLGLWHSTVGHAQEFAAGRSTFLDYQIFVTLAGQGGEHGFHRYAAFREFLPDKNKFSSSFQRCCSRHLLLVHPASKDFRRGGDLFLDVPVVADDNDTVTAIYQLPAEFNITSGLGGFVMH
jgi:hypothetical protein